MNILLLCSYPIENPKHGGQLRVRNIVDAYRRAGYSVEIVGVLGSEHYEKEDGFLPFPGVALLTTILQNPFLMEDYAIGRLFSQNDHQYKRLAAMVRSVPDVIQVEHPWLFAFAKRYIENSGLNVSLFYSSHNIECTLKKDIVSTYLGAEVANNYYKLINEVEVEAIDGADVISCVSDSDAQWLRSKTVKPVVLAPNGVKAWRATNIGKQEAMAITKGNRYALYCASAHPPNMTGFFDIFGGGFGSLKPDEHLVVAGGAGWAIAGDHRVHQSAKLTEKVVVAGLVSQPCLEGLLDEAHCIVLPLTQGGGTNLKTAEALWAGKHIVATSVAMRGFEQFIGANGVVLANDATSFKRALRLAMASAPIKLTEKDVAERRSVLWDDCLDPLLKQVASFTERIEE